MGERVQALVVQLLRVHGEGHSPYDIQKIAQHRARLQTGNPLSCWQDLAFIRGAALGDVLAAAPARHRPPRPVNSLLVPPSTRLSLRSA